MDAVATHPTREAAGGAHPAFLRLSSKDDPLMSETGNGTDDAAWVKMQIDMAVTKEKVDTVLGDVRGIREDLRNVYVTKTEFRDLVEDVTSLKNGQGWVIKIIVGAVIAAILGLVLVKGGATHL